MKASARRHRAVFSALLASLVLLPFPALAAQDYVGRYEVYNGFTYFSSSAVDLAERGYHLQVGVNPRTWVSLGFDYSAVSGTLTLTSKLLRPALQQQIVTSLTPLIVAGVIPPTYRLSIPTGSSTQTFAAGPQLVYRHFSAVTFFIRPSIGAIYEEARPHATDLISAGIIHQLAPSGKETDWAPFYGVGGGVDLNPTRHFSLRMQVDFVNTHLFSDTLKDSRNTVRLSIGPAIHFGRNIAH